MATGDNQILRDYFPVLTDTDRQLGDAVSAALDAIRATQTGPPVLTAATVLSPAEQQAAARAQEIISARGDLRSFLGRLKEPVATLGETSPGDVIRRLYQNMKGRNFGEVLGDVDRLGGPPISVPAVTSNSISKAFTSADVRFVRIVKIPVPPSNIIRTFRVPHNARGYTGSLFGSDQIARLVEFHSLLAGGPERDFRLRLWRAECHVGRARANTAGGVAAADELHEALDIYRALLPAAGTLTERQQFVAVRAGLAYLARGDALFRRGFRLTVDERAEARAAYSAAENQLGMTGAAAEQIKKYSAQQMAKLSAGQNILGYRDSYVPDLSPLTLAALADARIGAAIRASGQFVNFKTRADELVEELAALTQDELEREIGVKIAQETTTKEEIRVGAANDAIDHLKSKSDDILLGLGVGLAQAVFATVAIGASGVDVGGQASGSGIISALVQYGAAKEDLANQQEAATSALRIAERDKQIAELEKQLVDSRLQFMKDAIDAKKRNEFNADRFYAVANMYEDMTRRHLDRACELLYLYERAIAFRRLKSLNIVEAAAASGDILIAPENLHETWLSLKEEEKSQGPGQNSFPLPPWSLRERYPLEFARFLQQRSIDFVISVHELEKLLHGRYNVRVRRIGVEVRGLLSPQGFVGTLIHRGVTLVRDLESTLQPPATRLTPTDAELRAAVAELERGDTDRVVIQGLVPMVLNEGRLTISSESDVVIPDDDEQFDLQPIENYGLTGAWRLELPDTDLRGVTDVRLKFIVSLPQANGPLDSHVLGLIDTYESDLADNQALDAILAVSLRQRFPDAFDALETSNASFNLRDVDFPDDVTDLRVKAVVAQAVDVDGAGQAGIKVQISRPGAGLDLVRTTGSDGFTEDLSTGVPELPAPDRSAPTGSWRLQLLDRHQFTLLGDLTLFVMYTFQRDNR